MGATVNHIIGSFFPSAAIDVVGVYTQDYRQLFQSARPIKATIKPTAKVMEQPLETGASIIDHRIILPVEIELSLILASADYANVYQQINQLFLKGTLLIVQTKTGTYKNQLISSMPHDEDPGVYDAIMLALSLKETLFADTQVGAIQPKNPTDSNTVRRGGQQNTPANAGQNQKGRSALHEWFGDKVNPL